MLGDFDFRIIDGQASIFAELEARLYLELRRVLDGSTFDDRIHMLQERLANDLQVLAGDGVVKRQRQQPFHHLFLDLFGETGAYDAWRHFARTEAWDLRLAAEVSRDALRFGGDEICWDLDFDRFLDRGNVFVIEKHSLTTFG